MKKSKFTAEQIAFALNQAGSGTAVEGTFRKMLGSRATFALGTRSSWGMCLIAIASAYVGCGTCYERVVPQGATGP